MSLSTLHGQWCVARGDDGNDPETTNTSTALLNHRNLSIVEHGKVSELHSCGNGEQEYDELCLVGPTENTLASSHKVRVLEIFVVFEVLEGLKKSIFSTSRMCKARYGAHLTVGPLAKGLVRNREFTSEEASA